jgi:hypothetical protein
VLDNGNNTVVKDGEMLVLSDLVPAIRGMKLKPLEDKETVRQVNRHAAGGSI